MIDAETREQLLNMPLIVPKELAESGNEDWYDTDPFIRGQRVVRDMVRSALLHPGTPLLIADV